MKQQIVTRRWPTPGGANPSQAEEMVGQQRVHLNPVDGGDVIIDGQVNQEYLQIKFANVDLLGRRN